MTRLQFEVNEDELAKIEELMKDIGARRRAELFNYSLSLLRWALKERKNGRIIASLDEENGKYKELELPVLSLVGDR